MLQTKKALYAQFWQGVWDLKSLAKDERNNPPLRLILDLDYLAPENIIPPS